MEELFIKFFAPDKLGARVLYMSTDSPCTGTTLDFFDAIQAFDLHESTSFDETIEEEVLKHLPCFTVIVYINGLISHLVPHRYSAFGIAVIERDGTVTRVEQGAHMESAFFKGEEKIKPENAGTLKKIYDILVVFFKNAGYDLSPLSLVEPVEPHAYTGK